MQKAAKTIDVTIYTRPTCQRTPSAMEMLQETCRNFPVEIREVDVSLDVALEIAYGHDTPVVLIEGTERFRREVNQHELKIILQSLHMKKQQQRRRRRDE